MIGGNKMFVCLGCGHVFSEDEVGIWEESRGEYWGFPCSETMSGCPRCKGDYVKTYQCDCCSEWITGQYIKTENGERICEDCYTVYELGDED